MAAIEGVLHAFEIDSETGVREIGLDACGPPAREAVESETVAPRGWRWLHLGRDSLEARSWLATRSGLSDNEVRALLAHDTRPRATETEHGALLILRGVNTNPGAAPEDMVSIRVFIEDGRMVSVQGRRMHAVERARAALVRGAAPTLGKTLVRLIDEMREEMEPLLDGLQAAVDSFEIEALTSDRALPARRRRALNAARHDAIQFHRHIAPQAQALSRLSAMRPLWLSKKERESIRREADAFGRIAEDLETVRSRGVVVSDEAALRMGEETNRLILTLSVVSLIFLPMTFLTGLLGVNLAGIPFADREWSFDAFAISLVIFGGVLALAMRRLLR